MMNKKYADLIIKDSPESFNGIEIQGVREHSGVDDESFVEVDSEGPRKVLNFVFFKLNYAS